MFGPATEEVARGWYVLHGGKFYTLYSVVNIIVLVKSRRRWAGHVARLGKGETCTEFRLDYLK